MLCLPYHFTGEIRDWNGWQYHRARYYAPDLGVFPSLDPFEGVMDRPMSLNGYMYVEGDPVNMVDPSGNCVSEELPADTYHLAIKLNTGYCNFTPQFIPSVQNQPRLPCRAGGGIGNIRGGWDFQGTNGCEYPNFAWMTYVAIGPATVQIQVRLESGDRFDYDDMDAPHTFLTNRLIGSTFAVAAPNSGIRAFVICSELHDAGFFFTESVAIGGVLPIMSPHYCFRFSGRQYSKRYLE